MKNFLTFIVSLSLAVGITALIFPPKENFFDINNQTISHPSAGSSCQEVVVIGQSMEPTLVEGERVCAYSEPPKLNDLAVFKCKKCGLAEAVKRVTRIENDCYWVLGDNLNHSLDSREFGFLCPKDLEYIWRTEKE